MVNFNIKKYTKKPHITLNDIPENVENVVITVFKKTAWQSLIYERTYHDGKRYVSMVRSKVFAVTTPTKDRNALHKWLWFAGGLFLDKKNRKSLSDTELVEEMNHKIEIGWMNSNIIKVEIMFLGKFNEPIETRVYVKKAPAKMESKKMYASPVKKSNNLTESCKKMTGNIEVLGKNFGKLI